MISYVWIYWNQANQLWVKITDYWNFKITVHLIIYLLALLLNILVLCLWICLKLLTQWIILSCVSNWDLWELSFDLLYSYLPNHKQVFVSLVSYLNAALFLLVYPTDPFWILHSLLYISMNYLWWLPTVH